MDLERIERLIEMFARAPIAELEVSEDGWRLRLSRAVATSQATAIREAPPAPEPGTAPNGERPRAAHVVAAGLVGTFYRRPAPDKPPFVRVGDLVEDGQRLGLVEAMKTLIGVEADLAGRISEILAEDGASVQAGDPLFAIVPVGPA